MTGRQPYRNGMGDTAVDIAGFGLADKEVTLAEVLSDGGYNTIHIGKWHMGDIMCSRGPIIRASTLLPFRSTNRVS